MKKLLPVIVVSIIVLIGLTAMGLLAGSGFKMRDEKIAALEDDADELAERLGEVEKKNAELIAELAGLRAQKVKLPDDFDELVDRRIREAFDQSTDMNETLDGMITRKTDGMYEVVASLLNEQVDALKGEEEASREEQAERRRERMEEWRRQREEAELERLAEHLSLDDTQKEQVREINATMRERTMEEFAKMREEGRFDIPEVLKVLREENNEAMAAVLSEEQMEAYKEEQERQVGWVFNMMNRRRGREGEAEE
jgi:hypothetical protein